MANGTTWDLSSGKLVISKGDVKLKAFDDFFDFIVDPDVDFINLSQVTTNPENDRSILAQANVWGYPETRLSLLRYPGNENIREVVLTKSLVSFSAFAIPEIDIKNPKLSLTCKALGDENATDCTLETDYICDLVLSNTLSFEVRIARLGTRYSMQADFGRGGGLSPENIAKLLGGKADDLQDWLPADLQGETVEVQNLFCRIDPADSKKLIYLSTRLEFLGGKSWNVIPEHDFLTVGGLWASLNVDHPLESAFRFPQVRVGGTITIDSAHIDLTARWPDLAVQGEMRDGDELKIGSLFTKLGLSTDALPSGSKALGISSLGFLAEPEATNKSFSFHITIDELWEIEHGGKVLFEIASLSLSVFYQQGTASPLTGSFTGKLVINNYDVYLAASVQGAGGYDFAGSTGPGQAIPIGEVLDDLWAKFSPKDAQGNDLPAGPIQSALESFTIQNLRVSFNTAPASKKFTFDCDGQFDLPEEGGETTAETLTISIAFEKQGSGIVVSFYLLFNQRAFELDFSQDESTKNFIGAYQKEGGDVVGIKNLAALLSEELAAPIPEDLSITVKDLLFAYSKKNANPAAYLFGIDLGAELNLSNLPLVGKVLPPDLTLGVGQLQLILSSADVGATTVSELNGLLTNIDAQLPEPSAEKPAPNGTGGEALAIRKGLNVSARLNFGGGSKMLAMPSDSAAAGSPDASLDPGTTNENYSAPDNAKWIVIQKQLGPLNFERVGLQYQDGELDFLLDASLSAGGLTLSLLGLSVGMPISNFNINTFDPSLLVFNIRGIGIDYSSGGVEIGGLLLKKSPPPTGVKFEFDGAAIVKAEALTLTAIGSYAQMTTGQPSMFVFAVLDYPLGGPSFFFVEGLAAGFGYNRQLKLPEKISQVKTFPMVAIATRTAAGLGGQSLSAITSNISADFPPSVGDYFLGVGIKFNSFKLLDSFLLLTVSFGHHVEIGLLGSCSMVFPTPIPGTDDKTSLAEVVIDLEGKYLPEEGIISVELLIREEVSFILSKDCHLHGGAAFYAWLKDDARKGIKAGEFVMTIGGYHPKFRAPDYYPRVPRLGFNWQVTDEITIKGDGYFALVPVAVMAGGSLDATYESGSIKAWFTIGADFLISWKPYHYEASMYLDVGGSYDTGIGVITIDAGADLDIWGPEFSGTAEVHISFVSFTVEFGDKEAQQPQPITWDNFRKSFLPPADGLLSVTVGEGLIKAGKGAAKEGEPAVFGLGLVNPKKLVINAQSILPINEGTILSKDISYGGPHLNVGPCAFKDIQSEFTLELVGPSSAQFTYQEEMEISKNVPAALWGEKLKPGAHDDKLVEGCLVGYQIVPLPPDPPEHTQFVDKALLSFDPHDIRKAFAWAKFPGPATVEKSVYDVRKAALEDTGLLEELGFTPGETVDPLTGLASDFLGTTDPEVLFMY